MFDVDGTLVDSQHHIVEAQAMAFAAHGLPAPTRERALSVVGLSLVEAFCELAGPHGPVTRLADAYRDAWTVLRQKPDYVETLYPGAGELLGRLARRADLTLGIATGKSRRGVDRLLEAQGWRHLFASVQTADDHPSKPHPSMLFAALAETAIAATHATMVGDTSYDMAMAVAAQVRPLGVSWGYHPPAALHAAGAVGIAEGMDALERMLLEPMDATQMDATHE